MPALVRLYIINVLIGFVLSAVFTGLLLWLDVAGLRHLATAVNGGWIGVLMLFVSNGIVFAGVQFAIVIMGMAEDSKGGGTRRPIGRVPALVRAVARTAGRIPLNRP
ncbi:hypothetical protein OEW28_11070 [Defluviimonas sp. WL0002]|uniref:Uncharacterized protein n=1 Tax=Albidovulum marisflavi TaxID=2984159 RepID=A0ABT2ZDE8_9RHOB|nr:hypothetical protein [Defluviimonas sp. WL0002]MCV2869168.1 hypothetical protein [Defluviimonas sp. WL0002]